MRILRELFLLATSSVFAEDAVYGWWTWVASRIIALLIKGTKQHADGWDASSKAWAHMVLHLPHAEGNYGVTFNDVTKDAAYYTTTSRFVA